MQLTADKTLQEASSMNLKTLQYKLPKMKQREKKLRNK